MDIQQPIKRSVSFQLKPEVQLFSNMTPHSSPVIESSQPQIQMAQLNLEMAIETATQSLFAMNLTTDNMPALSLKKSDEDLTEDEYMAVTVSPKTAALGTLPLSPRSVNQIADMRQQEQTHIHQAMREANELEAHTSVFIDRNQGRPILVQFSSLREAWQFGLAYLYNHTEGSFNLFPIRESIHIRKIAQSWVNNEVPSADHYPPTPISIHAFPTAYKLGGTSLFSVTLYKGHSLPIKNPHTFRAGLIISGGALAMNRGPYLQLVNQPFDNTNHSNDYAELVVFNVQDADMRELDWRSSVTQVVMNFLTQNGVL